MLMNNEKNFEVQSVLAKAIKRAGEIHNNDKLKKQAEKMEKRIREHKKKKFKVLQTLMDGQIHPDYGIVRQTHQQQLFQSVKIQLLAFMTMTILHLRNQSILQKNFQISGQVKKI